MEEVTVSANVDAATLPAAGSGALSGTRSRTADVARTAPARPDLILRFKTAEIMVHWSIAVPFLMCYVSGVILKLFFNLSPGGENLAREILRTLHRIGGAGLIVLPTTSAILHRKDFGIHLYNIRKAWSWTVDDIKWLFLMGLAAISPRFHLPEQHKFNAAEKLNFMMVMVTYPVFITSGVLLLMPGTWFVTWVIHVAVALAVTPLVLGHIYMATVNPSTRVGLPGMVSGRVDRTWAKHHYRKWYREHFEGPRNRPAVPDAGSMALEAPAHLRCTACGAEHDVASWLTVIDSVMGGRPIACPVCGAEPDTISVVAHPDQAGPVLRGLEEAGVTAFLAPPVEDLALPATVLAVIDPAPPDPRRSQAAR
jgi:formate dehydrogenase subunit gamma